MDGQKRGEACNPCHSEREVLCANECQNIYDNHDHCGACNNKCPDYAKCIEGVCEETVECDIGFHAYQGECEEDSIYSCGKHGYSCPNNILGWADGDCLNGECYATACRESYRNDDGQCAALMNCPQNEHIYINTCEPDTIENCGKHGFDCLKLDGTLNAECINGECIANECEEAYCLSGNKCAEGYYSPKTCGINGAECVVCAADQTCSNGECVFNFCEKHQHIYEGECEDDNLENCGAHKFSCVISNAKSKVCDSGKCKVQECESGYHIYENACEMDDQNHCGAHDNACMNQIDGWKSGTCENQKCQLQSCISGHVYNNACEANDINNCGSHGASCVIDHAVSECVEGGCKLIKCDPGYYENHGRCLETQANGGATLDPWGLIWDTAKRNGTHNDAVQVCKNLGGRLPTPTEAIRNSATSGVSGAIGTTADTTGIWTDTTDSDKDYVELVKLATGALGKGKSSAKNDYRCVWDPTERPLTLSGVNCHGKPTENGCQEVKIGSINYIFDTRERPAQYWFQAAEECIKMGGRLPWPHEYPPLIVFGLANGSGEYNWSAPTSSGKAAGYKWNNTIKMVDDENCHFKLEFGSKRAFRCMSEPVKLDGSGKPVFPQPKVQNNDGVLKVGPLLWIDSSPRKANYLYDAEYQCMKDGGRLASLDEMTFAIKNGLPRPSSDTKGDVVYLTSSPANCTKICNSGVKFGTTIAPYYYPGSLSKVTLDTASPYYCTYRPARDYDYSKLDESVKNETMIKVSESGVDYYIDAKNTSLNSNLFNTTVQAMKNDMRLPTDGELVYMIKNGLPKGTGANLMTSKSGLKGDSEHYGFRGVTWSGTGSTSYDATSNVKFFKYTIMEQPMRKFAVTTIH